MTSIVASGGQVLPTGIAALAASGSPGRHVCPKCNGGSAGEASLSIRFDEAHGVHWRCFRALCGYTGGPRGTSPVFAGPKRSPRYFTRPIKPLTLRQIDFLIDLFGSGAVAGEVEGYSYGDDRFMLGVYGPTGFNRRGCIGYSFNSNPKSLTYNETPEEPFIHYARGVEGYQSHTVIVEDWFSAEKVALTGATGVAIMGTHLSQADITEIAKTAERTKSRTWLALDKDAYEKTLGYLFRYREQFPYGLYAWSLSRDLKYETKERIQQALNGKGNFLDDGKIGSGGNAEGETNL